MDEMKLPRAWQDWQITGEIGEGAYGRVYRAEKDSGGVTAVSAIKVVRVPSGKAELLSLRREFRSEEELRRNLKEIVDGYVNEIRVMYRLQGQTHIVSIQDHLVEETEDGPGWRIYIRMEYLQPFNDYAMTHSFTREETIRLGISLCEALGVCAGNGILHRDIKPENLFVTETGEFKLGDFGIAKALERTVSSYSSKGTFSYMAPEVFAGKPYDTRADLYSTGIILYKLVNRNRDPFVDTDKQIVTYQDREQAMSLRLKGEKLPAPADADEDLAKIILTACEFEPKDRYDSPDAMLQALKELLQPQNAAGGKPKIKRILLVCAAVILLVAGITAVILSGTNRPPEQEGNEAAGIQAAGTRTVSADELYTLGWVYFSGFGAEQDLAKAAELFTQAAEMGSAEAQFQLGVMYWSGQGVLQDAAKAGKLFLQAAGKGHVEAQCNLGVMYLSGDGVERDATKAAEMFRLAAEQGDAGAQNMLGLCYYYGDGVEQDYAKAVEWFLRAAEQGDSDAQNNLGNIYKYGCDGVEQDMTKAAEMFGLAAEQGHAEAQDSLGLCYYDGAGVEQNYVKAREWFLRAAEQENADAQNNLGRLYKGGHGVAQNDETALYWYRQAAQNGSLYACYNLGYFYENGIVVDQDYGIAAEYYLTAAGGEILDARERYEYCLEMTKAN